jgi:hypothetical protein
LRHVGLLFICITLEPCLSVNDGQRQTGQHEPDEAIDNNDKADTVAVLHEFLTEAPSHHVIPMRREFYIVSRSAVFRLSSIHMYNLMLGQRAN